MACRVAHYRHWVGSGYVERMCRQVANGIPPSHDPSGYAARIRGLGGISITDAARKARIRNSRQRKQAIRDGDNSATS